MAKYEAFPRISLEDRKWPSRVIEKAPVWCSVDLRDGNQALVSPMSVDQKLEMFELLLKIGFKEIEIGFPSASQIEFDFARRLIDEKRVPKGVRVQVLCQARRHLIERTMESLKGAESAIFHLYNSTSPVQRKVTFGMSKDEIKKVALDGVDMVKELSSIAKGTEISLEYSPESFSNTELDYAAEVCNAVIERWNPGKGQKIIINLPATVESATPNVHADQIEWMTRQLVRRDQVLVSLHTHNDRGTAIAAGELGLLAGADRVEGTLFGNGERTGNLDIVTMALNMFSQGIDSGLDFSDLPAVAEVCQELTDMTIPPRQPYAGELVYTAFSGSHQDAIKKGMEKRAELLAGGCREESTPWEVPYLPIDPRDIGRTYQAIIRINSQSGKGGVAYILKELKGMDIPKAMRPELGAIVNKRADELGTELKPEDVWAIFEKEYLQDGWLSLVGLREISKEHEASVWEATVNYEGRKATFKSAGNGPIDAFAKGLSEIGIPLFKLVSFHEDALTSGSDASAVAYVEIESGGKRYWGCGISPSVSEAGVLAEASAVNRMLKARGK